MSQTQIDRESPPGTPRWVKVFGTIVIVLILLVSVLHLTGHSSMSHMHHISPTHQGMQQP